MKKLLTIALFLVFLMSLVVSQVSAGDETGQEGVVDVGNKLCPVMGGPVNGKDFVVYEGKRYGFCCPGCPQTFLSDPAKYIARMERQETVPVAPEGTVVPIRPEKNPPLTGSDLLKSQEQEREMQRDMEQAEL